jgi:hypothetical protein
MPVISAYTGKKYIEINNLEQGSFCHWNSEPFLLNTSQVQGQLVKYFDTQKVKSVIYIAQDSFNLKQMNVANGLNYTLSKFI